MFYSYYILGKLLVLKGKDMVHPVGLDTCLSNKEDMVYKLFKHKPNSISFQMGKQPSFRSNFKVALS